MKSTKEIKERIIAAGYEAVEQLIKVAKEDIGMEELNSFQSTTSFF